MDEWKFQITKQDEENKQTKQWKTVENCFFFLHEASIDDGGEIDDNE